VNQLFTDFKKKACDSFRREVWNPHETGKANKNVSE